MSRGLFVVLEGPDGTGKTSSAHALHQALLSYHPTVLTKEPGGTPLGDALRTLMLAHTCDPRTELLLMSAARLEHVQHVITPALQAGQIVLCDRYIDSTYVYQGHRGVPKADIAYLHQLLAPPTPNLVFFFTHRYRTSVADRLEDLDQDNVLNLYRARQRASSIPWVMIPHADQVEVVRFMLNHIKTLLPKK